MIWTAVANRLLIEPVTSRRKGHFGPIWQHPTAGINKLPMQLHVLSLSSINRYTQRLYWSGLSTSARSHLI